MKRILAALMVIATVFSLCACGAASDKVFTCGDLSITLTDDFKESSTEGQDAFYESNKAGVTIVEDKKANIANSDTLTKKDYADLVVKTYEKQPLSGINEVGGLTSFTFVSTVDGNNFTYDAFVYETSTSFWLVQFFCLTENYGDYVTTFRNWAQSVTIQDTNKTETKPTENVVTTEPEEGSKVFTINNVSITLTEDFQQTTLEGQDAAFMSNEVGGTILSQTRKELTDLGYKGDTMTVKDYAESIVASNAQETSDLKEENGMVSYSYKATVDGYNFAYQVYIVENKDTFYMVQFYSLDANWAEQSVNFAKWVKTLRFS